MAIPRLWILIIRGRRPILAKIRGYLAERDDSDFADTLPSANPAAPLPFLGVRNIWQRGRKSAPIPALGNERLVAWGVWESVLPQGTRDALDAAEAEFPQFIRTFKQQGTVDGQGEFTPTETVAQFKSRILTAVGWINDTP